MKEYQLYLENIINALARVGVVYPAKINSYEDLFLASESIGSFLEINALLQRVGSGYSIAGFDESLTYRSYWYSEFYLEFQERVLTAESYGVGVSSEDDEIEVSTEVNTYDDPVTLEDETPVEVASAVSTLTEERYVGVKEFGYSGITGVDSDGFDLFGVALEDDYVEDDDEDSLEKDDFEEEEEVTLEADDPKEVSSSPKEVSYSGITGVDSDGFDIFGVALEDDYIEEEDDFEEGEVSFEEEEIPVEEVSDIPVPKEVSYSVITGVDADGFDIFGVELEEDEPEEVESSNNSLSEEDDNYDPDDPDSGNYEDLVSSSGFDLEEEEFDISEGYDEDNDPDNPDNGSYEDLVESNGYDSGSDYEEYDEDNDPDNGNYVDLVSSSETEETSEGYNTYVYSEDDDPDNPDNSSYVDLVDSSDNLYANDYDEGNDPDNPDNGNYTDLGEVPVEQPKQPRVDNRVTKQVPPKPRVPKSAVSKNLENTQNLLNVMGKFEKTILEKVRFNGKK